ncbi:MAG: hypothetical protein U1G07_14805 [Verrucomicrobiota bacterium]
MSRYLTALSARIAALASSLVCGLMALRLYGHLSKEAFGVVGGALTIMVYLPLLDGGFRTTINRAILAEPGADERGHLLRFGQILYSWLGLAIGLAALVLMTGYAFTPAGRSSGQPFAFFAALAISGALSVISSIQAGVLIGLQAQAASYFLTALSSWVNLGVLWVVLKEGGGVWAFPISTVCGVLCVYPMVLVLIRRWQPGLTMISFRLNADFWRFFERLRSDAWHCFRSQVSIVVLYTVDIVLVVLFCTPGEAAVYIVLSRMFAILRGFLQSMSEISWPFIAQRGWGNKQLNHVLNRMNAWAVGSVTGGLLFTLGPFCGWYIKKDWSPPDFWVWLMAARFLITSLASPAAYLLYGSGDFRGISRYLEKELLGGCVLAIPLGWSLGVAGIAASFVLSTAFGTLFPIYRAYTARTGDALPATLAEIWSRAVAGLTISVLCTKLALGFWAGGSQLIVAGALGVVAGLGTCCLWSLLRMSRADATVSSRMILRFMNGI